MRVLSLSRPWTWAIFDPIADKGIENRSWPPPIAAIDDQIAIQAAQSWDDDVMGLFLKLGLDHFPHRKDQYPHSVIVGVATLDRVVTEARTLGKQARWFFGEYGWVLTHRIALVAPVPCKGAQGLRTLPADIEIAVTAQLARQAQPASDHVN